MKAFPKQKTMAIVAGLHVLLLGLFLCSSVFQKKPEPMAALEWVDLPVPEPLPPPEPAEPIPQPVSQPPRPEPVPVTPAERSQPEPVAKVIPPPQPATIEKTKPKPTPPKPAEVKVDLTKTVTKSLPTRTPTPIPAVRERLATSLESVTLTSSQAEPSASTEIERYHRLIRNALFQAWERPPGGNRPLSAQVAITVAGDGSITFQTLASKSGFEPLDQSVIAAARQAVRVPEPLPASLGKRPYPVTINFVLK